ncbi:MAG: sigma-70 family RNA polymerase sigma factor [Planctomycetota bacterium]
MTGTPPDPDPAQGEATRLLDALSSGDKPAQGKLLELVYDQLRKLAGAALRSERIEHTLQPTALVHEAWLRLIGQTQVNWQGRDHFLAVAAIAMRRVLVDYARARQRAKRGGGAPLEDLNSGLADLSEDLDRRLDVLALHEGLERLAQHSERASRVVELRFFAGLSEDDTARILGVTRATVTRDWRAARAWLQNHLDEAGRVEPE